VRRDLLPHGLAQAMPQVPAVADLDRRWQRLADGLAVSTRSVTAHDLDPGDDVDAPSGLGVDEHGGVDQAAAQREVIDAEHPRHRHPGQGDPQEDPHRGMPGDHDAQCWQQPRRGPAG
jgi:hypothetical protein